MTTPLPSFPRTREPLVRSMTLALALLTIACTAHATLPPPTPQEAAAQAAKKAAADAQAAKDKQELYAMMDTVAAHWRGRAAKEHWTVHPAIAVPPPAPPPAAAPPGTTGSASPAANPPATVPPAQPAPNTKTAAKPAAPGKRQ
ncbi:MAG: hypothetical protein ACXWKJ_20700 [Telluria sp.]